MSEINPDETALVIGTYRSKDTPEDACGRCVHKRWDEKRGVYTCDVYGEKLSWRDGTPEREYDAEDDFWSQPSEEESRAVRREPSCVLSEAHFEVMKKAQEKPKRKEPPISLSEGDRKRVAAFLKVVGEVFEEKVEDWSSATRTMASDGKALLEALVDEED